MKVLIIVLSYDDNDMYKIFNIKNKDEFYNGK